ncbi:MAG: alkaline phosphatase [Pseudomonadota bacterium]
MTHETIGARLSLPRRRLRGARLLVPLLLLGGVLAGCESASRVTHDANAGSTARGIILFMGDGMGISTVTAARIYAGQSLGLPGEAHALSFENFPHVALVKTYNTDMQVPDSAGTMTAIATGKKTRAGMLSVGPQTPRGDCASALRNELPTLLERLEAQGWQTGLISTARITHATPAALYSHSPDRDWEADSDLPDAARVAGCRDIARQLVEFGDHNGGDGVDVVLGGGRAMFYPQGAADAEAPEKSGDRTDGRDLVAEWLAGGGERSYAWNTRQLDALGARDAGAGQVLGLFERSHMQFEADRDKGPDGEPDLAALTEFAIRRLRQRAGDGRFFLMVEAGRIDHAHHFNNAYRALEDTLALDAAVQRAQSLTGDDTLIMVTADHSHTFTISGYPRRGNPMLGLVRGPNGELQLDATGQPYTTLGYANGPSARNEPRPLTQALVTAPDYQQASTVALYAETHAGEDVAAYAIGPAAVRVRGVLEQNALFDVLAEAAR